MAMVSPPATAPLVIDSFNKCLLSPGLRKARSCLLESVGSRGGQPSPVPCEVWEGMRDSGPVRTVHMVTSRAIVHLLHFQLPFP